MTAAAKETKAEIIRLPFGIPGVGRKGDCVMSDPDNPDPGCRLVRVGTLDVALLPAIKERVAEHSAPAADTDAQEEVTK